MRQPLGDYDERDDEFELVGEHRAEEEYERRGRRLPTLLLFIVAMVVFAGGLWFAYFQGARHAATTASGNVPVIRADQTPDKVKPAAPGGMQIPDQNVSLYNERPGAAPVEKLLPPPEKPLPRPAPETRQAPLPPSPAASTPTPGGTQPSAPTATAQPTPPSAAPARTAAPLRPSTESRPAGPPKSAAAASAEGGRTGPVQIRLASVRTPEEARAEWQRLKHDNADLLGSVTARAIRTDLGGKGIYYRVEAGPFENAAAASRMCSELKRRGLGCILAR